MSLLPAESIVLTVAKGQLARGENPTINITAGLVATVERLVECIEGERSQAQEAAKDAGRAWAERDDLIRELRHHDPAY